MTRIVAGLYFPLCAGALLLIPASIYGWFGVEQDPLGGVFAFLLALPWVLVASAMTDPPLWVTILVIIAGMATNTAIILAVGRWAARRSAG